MARLRCQETWYVDSGIFNENIKNISGNWGLPNLNREGFGENLDCKNSALIHIQINVHDISFEKWNND